MRTNTGTSAYLCRRAALDPHMQLAGDPGVSTAHLGVTHCVRIVADAGRNLASRLTEIFRVARLEIEGAWRERIERAATRSRRS